MSWDGERRKWQAQGKANGRKHHIGRFDSEEEAAEAASDFRLKHLPFTNENR